MASTLRFDNWEDSDGNPVLTADEVPFFFGVSS